MKKISLFVTSIALCFFVMPSIVLADEVALDEPENISLASEEVSEDVSEESSEIEVEETNDIVLPQDDSIVEDNTSLTLDEPGEEITPTPTPDVEVTPDPTPVVTVTPELTPEVTPDITPEITPTVTPESEEKDVQIRAFVERMYSKCLNRGSDTVGIDYWSNELATGNRTGANVASRFVFSDEYISRNATDEEFVTMLYYTFFDREPDSVGFDYWIGELSKIHTREYVFACFVNSAEFKTICENYGIVRGSYTSPHSSDYATDVASFVERLYEKALERKQDITGIDYWTSELATFSKTPLDVAKLFFFSEEFKSKDLSNEDFVKILYLTCMDREADDVGLNHWVTKLENEEITRYDVLAFFLSCKEFRTIMKDSGVAESSIVTVAKTQVGETGGLKYCNWYGYRYRIEWCACFVSWCANQCGYINSGVVPKYKWCLDARDWFMERNQWVSDSKYRPKSGDIIFYDWNGNGVIDHTGIVVGTESNGRIHTIEGNTYDVVRNDRVIYVGDPDICGYGIPNYG